MTFSDFCRVMSKANAEGKRLTGVIVFTQDSFAQDYTEQERAYRVSSMAKYFRKGMLGSALLGNCLDGKDLGVRLDYYMKAGSPRWKVEKAYIKEEV